LHPDELPGFVVVFGKNDGGGGRAALQLDLYFELFHGGDFANIQSNAGNFISIRTIHLFHFFSHSQLSLIQQYLFC
jgi:hypothetical protein